MLQPGPQLRDQRRLLHHQRRELVIRRHRQRGRITGHTRTLRSDQPRRTNTPGPASHRTAPARRETKNKRSTRPDQLPWEIISSATAVGRAAFPYIPGLLSFRELPPLLDAWSEVLPKLAAPPDLVLCDGHGIAHPRRFGLACHLGITLNLPTIGVAKTPFVGTHTSPGQRRGERTEILLDGEPVGAALRTRDGVREVYLSVGHRSNLDSACRWVLELCPKYRLPETTRAADHLSRAALAAHR
ncbi:endonuclease V [Candidatus Frankia nodulisporulans]|uniref:endonuclease V n=1 Tax=Candidatus Frankia nodulisporulans TaxID=2060052 RepID=UPI0030B837B9